jgi:hypothetical protein
VSVEHNVSHEVLDLLLLMVEWTKEAHACMHSCKSWALGDDA